MRQDNAGKGHDTNLDRILQYTFILKQHNRCHQISAKAHKMPNRSNLQKTSFLMFPKNILSQNPFHEILSMKLVKQTIQQKSYLVGNKPWIFF